MPGGGGVRRMIFVKPDNGAIWNRYIVGSGIGAVTSANRSAYKRRSNNNASNNLSFLNRNCCTL